MKRLLAFLLLIVLLVTNTDTVYACDESQSNNRVLEILFGDDALVYSSDDNAKMLLSALYLCCEQSDNQGQDKIDFLKKKKVKKPFAISDINIKNSELIECCHISWEYEYFANDKVRTNRKKILQNTVNKVFDFGTFNNLFGSEKGECNSFAALLYYSHILSDYLADDPESTETQIKGRAVPSYCGQAYIDINGGRPFFTSSQKKVSESYLEISSLDSHGRSGVAIAVLGADTLAPPNSRHDIGMIKPSGWNQEKYPGMVNSEPAFVYNRCHLIAHQLAGYDEKENLITGTRYLNEIGMKPFEDRIAQYIKSTNNHVLYRATPIFDGDNKVASGVQLEAYSLEDAGRGICFNVYCYNVQPGIKINYLTGKSEKADIIYDAGEAMPFAVNNPSDDNPDLIYEISKHLEVLFANQKGANSSIYTTMMGDINSIAYEARSLGKLDEKPAQKYMKLKECEYEYFQTLKMYVPLLLKNKKFFTSTFKS